MPALEQMPMRHPVKLFGLVAIATLIAPAIQAPGFSETTQQLRLYPESSPVLAQANSGSDRKAEADDLFQQGLEYYQKSRFEEALRAWEKALKIYQEVGNRDAEERVLGSLGNAYFSIEDYENARIFYVRQLSLVREMGNRGGEARVQVSLGWAYGVQGQYQLAIEYFEEALAISKDIGNISETIRALYALGWIYHSLGQVQDAVELYELAFSLANEDEHSLTSTMNLLNGLGWAFVDLKQYQKAIDLFSEQLVIAQSSAEIWQEANALNGLGFTYAKLGQYQQAINYSGQALAIHRQIGDSREEAYALGDIGNAYFALGNNQKAIEYLGRCLLIQREINNRWGEGITLSSIAKVMHDEGRDELAIAFLKSSVQVRESIRGDIRGLATELQQSFADTVADDYRFLADLLLQQNRILEAQRVLDLLKVQELDESLRSVDGNSDTETGVGFWQVEEDLLALYEQVTAESAELADLQAQDYDRLSPEQQQRLDELKQRYETVQNQFITFLDRPEVQALLDQIADETDRQNVDIERQHRKLQNQLRTLPQETALLYPLILPDRLELVLVTADGPPLRYPIVVTGADLNRKIVAFGQALKSPGSDIQPLAQDLYTLLFAELEATLDQAGIESIIYAPDGALRYVPLAALHDGEQYLADRFSISHIVAASLTDFALPPDQGRRRLLAAACAECSFTITVGDRQFPFSDLPYTEAEVTSLAAQVPDTTVLLNQDFDLQELENRLNNYSILHLATHGAVVENAPAQSFVVLGSGETVSLETIRNTWRLDAELVVLSACETAIGSEELGSGVEILGLGYQIQEAGAQAVLASLWKVSDRGTQSLMTEFYAALNQGLTKAEALQTAQRALIASDTVSDADDPRASARPLSRDGGAIASTYPGYSHPYYWAPFILIGNGL